MNLLKETKEILAKHNRTLDDIIFVGDCEMHTRISVSDFIKKANFCYYNDGGCSKLNVNYYDL